eukprot:scaffold456_cov368-Pavlova_lutheri.AAC.9
MLHSSIFHDFYSLRNEHAASMHHSTFFIPSNQAQVQGMNLPMSPYLLWLRKLVFCALTSSFITGPIYGFRLLCVC